MPKNKHNNSYKTQKQTQTKTWKKNIKKDEEALVGIGTIIIFIGMILIAAVAATVIIGVAVVMSLEIIDSTRIPTITDIHSSYDEMRERSIKTDSNRNKHNKCGSCPKWINPS